MKLKPKWEDVVMITGWALVLFAGGIYCLSMLILFCMEFIWGKS